MPALRKYPNELRERAQRLVGEAGEHAGAVTRPLQPPAELSVAVS
jgi:hypothetical protein